MRDWEAAHKRYRDRQRAGVKRAERLAAARSMGAHTKEEWRILHDIFGACVSCGLPYGMLHGGSATKDHIVPLHAGGCDCLANLQPACRSCNTSGIWQDLREAAVPDWQAQLLKRIECEPSK